MGRRSRGSLIWLALCRVMTDEEMAFFVNGQEVHKEATQRDRCTYDLLYIPHTFIQYKQAHNMLLSTLKGNHGELTMCHHSGFFLLQEISEIP